MGCGPSKTKDVPDIVACQPVDDENTNHNHKPASPDHNHISAIAEQDEDLKKDTFDTQDFSEMELNALNAHNEYRLLHGSPEMVLDRGLCDMAQKWADHLAKERAFEHSPKPRVHNHMYAGENLYYFATTGEMGPEKLTQAGVTATRSWYKEIADYDFEEATFKKGTGHFTQVIWRGSAALGVALATYQDDKWTKAVVVANYSPGGNIKGFFKDHVREPLTWRQGLGRHIKDILEMKSYMLHDNVWKMLDFDCKLM